MKKSLCIFIFAAAAGLCTILFAIWAVDSEKGNITVTETVVEGDVAAAEGISVEIGTHWEGQLLWNTEYQPGHVEEAASSFDFSGQKTRWDYSNPRAWNSNFTYSGEVGNWRDRTTAYVDLAVVSTDFGTAQGINAATGSRTYYDVVTEDMPWSRLLQAAKDQTAAGENRTVTLRVRDYYDCYPLEFSVFDATGMWHNWDHWGEIATDFFKFRIPEDEQFQITIRKDWDGKVLELNCRSMGEGYFNGRGYRLLFFFLFRGGQQGFCGCSEGVWRAVCHILAALCRTVERGQRRTSSGADEKCRAASGGRHTGDDAA